MSEKVLFEMFSIGKDKELQVHSKKDTAHRTNKKPSHGWSMNKMPNKIISCYHSKISCVLTEKSF